MANQFEQDRSQINSLLETLVTIAEDYFARVDQLPPISGKIPDNTMSIGENGIGAKATLTLFQERIGQIMPAPAGPRYFGFVNGGTTPSALIGDWLASTYDVNFFARENSPAHVIEEEALLFLKQLLQIPLDMTGVFVTGATMSNFVSLAIAREFLLAKRNYDTSLQGLYGAPRIHLLAAEPHSTIFKSLSMLGMGRNSVTKIAKNQDRETIDIQALETELNRLSGEPIIVSGSAGTVNTGDFDDLKAIGSLKKKHEFFFHVDAAFGGFAGASKKYRHLLEGIEQADSITVDQHKWLNVPYDSSVVFTRHRNLQSKIFQNTAEYLPSMQTVPDYLHLTPESSRRWRSLSAWFTLVAYGRDGYSEMIERHCDCARYLHSLIETSDSFESLTIPRLNIACFALRGKNDMKEVQHFHAILSSLGDVYFSVTKFKDRPALRAAFVNWRTQKTDVEIAFESLKKAYSIAFP